MPALLQESSQTALWQRLIADAQQRARLNLNETLESYLIFVLMRHTAQTGLGHDALALEYLNHRDLRGADRQDQLRDVGDQCLLIAGLFPERARHRRVTVDYYIELGSGAYRDLSDALRESIAELYRELAETFDAMVRVLLSARNLTGFEAGDLSLHLNRPLH